MNIRQFKALLAVIETGSLNKAAQQLRVSQPALTKSIQRLEAQLGVRLFARGRSGMRPTPYAEMLRSYAEAATSGLGQVRAKIDAVKSGHRSTWRSRARRSRRPSCSPRRWSSSSSERPTCRSAS